MHFRVFFTPFLYTNPVLMSTLGRRGKPFVPQLSLWKEHRDAFFRQKKRNKVNKTRKK